MLLVSFFAAAITMLPLCSERELNELLARKEEEWRVLQAHRAQLQEAALQAAQNRLEETQGKLQRLQEDFVYNLQVLEERDRELERYDVEFTQARQREEAQQAEASELKIEVAKLKQDLTREARRVGELQHQHQLMLQEHRLELERVHRCVTLTGHCVWCPVSDVHASVAAQRHWMLSGTDEFFRRSQSKIFCFCCFVFYIRSHWLPWNLLCRPG
jgi:DNA repair exonuclease SbcCD ATPase subunit